MNKFNKVIIIVVVLLVVGGGAFYGGMIYGKNQSAQTANSFRANFAGRTGGRTGAGSNFTLGNIIGKDSTSITLQLPNSSGSKIIFYSSTTQISKMAPGTPDDLSNGTNVSVSGTTNSDGSITAQSIQIRPAQKPTPGQ